MIDLGGKRIVIAGGSGFLGVSMAVMYAEAGADITILSRSQPKVSGLWKSGSWKSAIWDGRTLGDWSELLEGADAIINLADRTVNCIKTPDHQDEILRSRVESTRVLGEAMRSLRDAPPVWIQMSTAHIYGDSMLICNEDSSEGIGFAPTIGRAWEAAFEDSKLPSQRGVIMRTSFVVGRERGAGQGALVRGRWEHWGGSHVLDWAVVLVVESKE